MANLWVILVSLINMFSFHSGQDIQMKGYKILKNTRLTQSHQGVNSRSNIECAIKCILSNCSMASFNSSTGTCFLSISSIDTELANGWNSIVEKGNKILSDDLKTWANARTHCLSIGGALATVKSSEDQTEILNLISGIAEVMVWIGGSDEILEGDWKWHDPDDTISLNYWGPNRPDNSGGDQDCLVYRNFGAPDGWKWDDRECYMAYRYICELLY